jgi:hypothetical protein
MMNRIKLIILIIVSLVILPSTAYANDALTPLQNDSSLNVTSMLIPDSIADRVKSVLEGHSVIVPKHDTFNPDEKVLFKGDTVNMYLRSKNFGRYDRGLYNHLFIPRGVWKFGLTVSYGEFKSSDLQIFDLLTDFDFSGHTFSIKPYVSYFVANNASLGIRFAYSSSRAGIGSMSVDFDEDINFAIKDTYYDNESYSAGIMYTQYIGLSRRGRFGFFSETELSFASGNSDFSRVYDEKNKLTHTTYMESRLSFSPGICVVIMKNVSFNVSFAVIGFYLRNEKQKTDGIESGNRFSSGANFRFNIFNINFGIGVHI